MLRPALCILLYVVLATVYLERWPVPDFDEGVYANPALNLIQKGNFGSSAMSGVLDLGRVTFWFLPLHSLLLWVPIKLFGFHLWSVRLLSAVCGLLTLLALYKFARSLGVSGKAASLLILFMGTDFMFLSIARFGRMEALLCFFHVTLLLLLVHAHQSGRSRPYFVPGLLAGACLMTHPLGSLAIPAFLLFSWPKSSSPEGTRNSTQWLSRAGTFALGLIVACLPYLAFVVIEGPGEFWQQLVVYQAHYCYDKQGFVGGPLANAARLVKMWLISRAWPFFLLKLLLLGWLAWPVKTARRLFALVLIDLVLLSFAWPSGAFWEYWIPTLYSTLAVCASAGKISSILADPGQRFAGLRRTIAGLVFSGLVALNLTAVFRALYRYHTNDVGRFFSELTRISLGEAKGKPRVLENTTFLFAFPEEDFRSCLVVRSSMDLRNIGWDRALLEVAPEILLVDDLLRSGQWPAFQLPPGCLDRFLSRYGNLRGTVRGALGGRDNLVQVYKLNLAAFARDGAARRAPEGRNGSSPPFPCTADFGRSTGGAAQRNGKPESPISAQ
jgi:4-amino-4-deoxy-L-arabinose transferase-like glycosyltransferase